MAEYQPRGWQRFGYAGRAGTCKWCGRKLRHKQVIDPDSTKEYPGNLVTASRAGGYQDDMFCGLRCGYQLGLRLAQLGHRLETATSRPA